MRRFDDRLHRVAWWQCHPFASITETTKRHPAKHLNGKVVDRSENVGDDRYRIFEGKVLS
jgi:hypothetical protein